ncbi:MULTISPECIES: DegQ family serine endoprotease [Alphaproteobacteria]|uniref:Serine protease n=2 Tax=Alphaproteobacteria TaxID=28211 RepID=A0A512HNX9_9HYPH|nr:MULTISPECIES: DegQ family serine endoprotease [Alphaproteobacteria]GEO87152.1 serine protease [Ciceribacter naphthalenivorans]GLR23268.1 serine protease [Ciceribacter naphthalenivorans]GLT06124.1 serine protease [Sphingomonas psychrolutea]
MQGFVRLAAASIVSLALLAPGISSAEDASPVPQSRTDMQMSFAPLVKQTHGAVVNVYAERMVQRRVSPFAGDPFFEQFFGQRMPNRTEKQTSLGSGVIVGANGMVVTNNHVIDGADDIKVALSDGREFPVKVVLKDERLDLAVLKIDAKEALPALVIADSDQVDVGDLVLAIGNPFGVGQTVTSGIVSGLARNQVTDGDFGFFIQTDASINPGNSGGALMNMKGELIGINTAIFSKGGGSNGIGFAIPANLVKVFLAAAERGDASFERPYVGATFEPVTSDVAEALGLDKVRGALVVRVAEGGPAAKAGLKAGQVIVAIDGIPVEHPDALGYRLTTAGLGKAVKLSVRDNGRESEISMTLAAAPETTPRDERLIEGSSPFAGAKVANLSPKLAYELRMPSEATGVAITEIAQGSPAARLGFAPHDIIVSVNGVEISSTAVLAKVAADDPGFWRVEVERDGQRIRQIFR